MPTKDLHTQKITAGSRTYFFDVKKCSNDGLYVKMSCSQKSATGFDHYRIIVFERDLLEFVLALKKSAAKIQKLKAVALTGRRLRPLK